MSWSFLNTRGHAGHELLVVLHQRIRGEQPLIPSRRWPARRSYPGADCLARRWKSAGTSPGWSRSGTTNLVSNVPILPVSFSRVRNLRV